MQFHGLHKNIYKLYAYSRTHECLDVFRQQYEDKVQRWESLKAEAVEVGGFAYIGAVAGGAIGSLGARWIGKHHSNHIEGQINKGGLLLWVSLRDPEHEERVLAILKEYNADHVHVHTVPRDHVPEGNPPSGFTIDPFLPDAHV